jgi:hypothetical protein
MGLYNFQPRFVPFIEDGRKKHTIRAIRANVDKPGNIVHLYVGLRHKGARLIGRFECTRVESIVILPGYRVYVEGVELSKSECESLAKCDGFQNFMEMKEFWDGRLPFTGTIIHWK